MMSEPLQPFGGSSSDQNPDREKLVEATEEAIRRYNGDVDETGATFDDWGYSAAERQAFVAGSVWTLKAQPADIASEIRLLRHQLGELCRILTPPGYPVDPFIPDESEASNG